VVLHTSYFSSLIFISIKHAGSCQRFRACCCCCRSWSRFSAIVSTRSNARNHFLIVCQRRISLSSACTTALTGLLTSPDAACLNPTSLLSYAVSSQKSIPDTIDQWLTGLCASGSCSNDSLAQVVTNVTTGCNAELAQVGISTDANDSIINIVQQAYPTARKVVCLKE
jgi:hypothetical protein